MERSTFSIHIYGRFSIEFYYGKWIICLILNCTKLIDFRLNKFVSNIQFFFVNQYWTKEKKIFDDRKFKNENENNKNRRTIWKPNRNINFVSCYIFRYSCIPNFIIQINFNEIPVYYYALIMTELSIGCNNLSKSGLVYRNKSMNSVQY